MAIGGTGAGYALTPPPLYPGLWRTPKTTSPQIYFALADPVVD